MNMLNVLNVEEHDFNIVKQSIYCKYCKVVYDTNVVLYGDSIPRYEEAID